MSITWDYTDPLDLVIHNLEREVAQLEHKRELLDVLRAKRRQSRSPIASPPPDLRGLKLALVGPSFRAHEYTATLAHFGLRLIFAASEEKKSQVHRLCSKAHGILHITTFSSHSAGDQASLAAARKGIPIVRLHQSGLNRLRETVLRMAPDMLAFRDLLAESKRTGGPA